MNNKQLNTYSTRIMATYSSFSLDNIINYIKDHANSDTIKKVMMTSAFATPVIGIITHTIKKIVDRNITPDDRVGLADIDAILNRIEADRDNKIKLKTDLELLDAYLNKTAGGKNLKRQLIIQLREEGILDTGFFKGLTSIKSYSELDTYSPISWIKGKYNDWKNKRLEQKKLDRADKVSYLLTVYYNLMIKSLLTSINLNNQIYSPDEYMFKEGKSVNELSAGYSANNTLLLYSTNSNKLDSIDDLKTSSTNDFLIYITDNFEGNSYQKVFVIHRLSIDDAKYVLDKLIEIIKDNTLSSFIMKNISKV